MCIVLAAIPAFLAAAASAAGSAAAAAGAAVGITSTAGALAAAGSVAGLAGTAVSAIGAQQQANAQSASADYQSKVNLMQAQSVQDSARINEQQTYRQGDLLEGRARAAGAANGIDPNSGTSLLNQGDIATKTGQNVADEGYNASLQGWGYTNQASLLSSQAADDKVAGNISSAGSLLSGASQVADRWNSWQSARPPGSASNDDAFAGAGVAAAGWGS